MSGVVLVMFVACDVGAEGAVAQPHNKIAQTPVLILTIRMKRLLRVSHQVELALFHSLLGAMRR
jgi:hypothetical protein